ncbi:nucleolar protein c7c, putative [Pediculus humanus corporis]|uniref:Oxidation resistance protein 1 n=1 Tax=Pediculus humanus subsp. corporis TaxID=121224 RepID=E0VWP1_PEDHC|nr:nucleolar protein c7c, putative [Pediculus humanus corporis]EEB17797.1 nucleolar protein c7c, putative [Pediculus humanus corporis]
MIIFYLFSLLLLLLLLVLFSVQVQASDTLNSVAARFDITPSELRKLNRLASSLIFPGQLIHVPDKKNPGEGDENADETLTSVSTSEDGEHEPLSEEKEILDNLRPVSPKPGHIERVKAPTSPQSRRHEARFLKINVRLITDGQGVVSGVLLVTPNTVMFDPNVSDPLVIEHGSEFYSVIAPMELVVNAAIYYDIAHMKVGHKHNKSDCIKPEIYYAEPKKLSLEPQGSPGRDSLLVKDETFPELAPSKGSSDEDNESLSSYVGRDGDAFPKAFDRDLVTPTNLNATPTNNQTTTQDVTLVSQQSCPETGSSKPRTLEERRTSSLDHHWAIPKPKSISETVSFQSESEKKIPSSEESAQKVEEVTSSSSSSSSSSSEKPHKEESLEDKSQLTKLSCYDSGIDIRDSASSTNHQEVPIVVTPLRRVTRDADIIFSSKDECVVLVSNPDMKKKNNSVSFSVDSESNNNNNNNNSNNSNSNGKETGKEEKEDEKVPEGKKSKMLKRLSYPLAWMEGSLVSESKDSEKDSLSSLPTSADSQHSSVFSKVFSRRSSVGAFIRSSNSHEDGKGNSSRSATPKLDYRSMVSVEDMPELFVSFDKLILRPARPCEDPPLYLRLRMGKPINKKIPKSTLIMSYGKKKMRPEYWFGIPRNRVDELYNFLHIWVPHYYGDLEDMDLKSRGYELVESDTELWDDEETTQGEGVGESGDNDDLTDLTRESWEVLSMSEELRRALYASSVGSLDLETYVPDLVGSTEILTEEHRKQLCRHLPARAEGYLWTLVFSTSQHGFSLNSLYRKMTRIESPILLVIQDTDNNVFGALTSCSLKVSDHFYGTGESLLFRFNPEFSAYQWTGDNMYFIKGNNESLAIGAGDGKFGLWLDGDLNLGRSEKCTTYGNPPLSSKEDFVVKTLECWAFI